MNNKRLRRSLKSRLSWSLMLGISVVLIFGFIVRSLLRTSGLTPSDQFTVGPSKKLKRLRMIRDLIKLK